MVEDNDQDQKIKKITAPADSQSYSRPSDQSKKDVSDIDDLLLEAPTGMPAWASELSNNSESPVEPVAAPPLLYNPPNIPKWLSEAETVASEKSAEASEKSPEDRLMALSADSSPAQLSTAFIDEETDNIEIEVEDEPEEESVQEEVSLDQFSQQIQDKSIVAAELQTTVYPQEQIDSSDRSEPTSEPTYDSAQPELTKLELEELLITATVPIAGTVAANTPISDDLNNHNADLASSNSYLNKRETSIDTVDTVKESIITTVKASSPFINEAGEDLAEPDQQLELMEIATDSTDAPFSESGSLSAVIASIDREIAEADNQSARLAVIDNEPTIAKENFIVFSVAQTKYAIPIGNVIEMDRVPKITSVPNVPDWVTGVTNLRGEILSVIEFRAFLGITSITQSDNTRMLVVRSLRDGLSTGLIVDEVKGMRALVREKIIEIPAGFDNKAISFLNGMYNYADEWFAVLDLERLLCSPEIKQFESP